jgi:hypothetical protein
VWVSAWWNEEEGHRGVGEGSSKDRPLLARQKPLCSWIPLDSFVFLTIFVLYFPGGNYHILPLALFTVKIVLLRWLQKLFGPRSNKNKVDYRRLGSASPLFIC